MNRMLGFLFVIVFMVISLDLISFKILHQLFPVFARNNYMIFIFWIFTGLVVAGFLVLAFTENGERSVSRYYFFMLLATMFIIFYFPKIFVAVAYGLDWLVVMVKSLITSFSNASSRDYYFPLTKIFGVFSLVLIFFLLNGWAWGRFAFRANQTTLVNQHLPENFNDYKIVQFSDLHIGSFYYHPKAIKRIVKLINEQEPDVILFTGDWVNNFTEEALPYVDDFKQLKSKYGNFAVLGNHDYGEYFNWKSEDEYQENLQHLNNLMGDMGFRMLNNDYTILKKGADSVRIAGVENWGIPPFPQHGELEEALHKKDGEFTILLSHDPSHWDEEIVPDTDVELTLSGHTHGMQFGIKTKRFKWSPVALKYPKWGGWYYAGKQAMHVSTGIGNIGYFGRWGMWPEIDVITLKTK